MIKRFVLVVFVCLTALLISSCSDSGTESGVEFGLAKEQIPSTAVDACDAEGGKYSRSSDCEIKFDEARYVDHKLHKLLGKCDTVNEIAAYIGMTESTATLTQWFKRWCTSEHGSTPTIIDADEQQCSSGTGVYNVGTVGYVNKYGDLVATYNANSGGRLAKKFTALVECLQ